MSHVEVRAYDPDWPQQFAQIHSLIWPAVHHVALGLEHVGSTAVPGLAAKPVIDACLVVSSRDDMPSIVSALAAIGYRHRGDLGIPDREAFRAPDGLPRHHLYASHRGSLSCRNHLGLRDLLRADPVLAQAYGELKQQLARQHADDMTRYVAGKTDFILSALRRVGLADEELTAVRAVNS